jgi:hypothetical protein
VALPAWFVPDGAISPAHELYKARNDVRTTAVRTTAGIVVQAGLAGGAAAEASHPGTRRADRADGASPWPFLASCTPGRGSGRLSLREADLRNADFVGGHLREHAHVVKVAADGVLLEDGDHVDADVVVWTAGFRVPPLAREAGLAVGDNGRMLVDATLRSVSHPEVYGIGDAAAARKLDGRELRMGCGPGGYSTVCAVRAIGDRLAGRTPRRCASRATASASASAGRTASSSSSTPTTARAGRSSPAAWSRWSRSRSSAGPRSDSATPPSPSSPPAARWPDPGTGGPALVATTPARGLPFALPR